MESDKTGTLEKTAGSLPAEVKVPERRSHHKQRCKSFFKDDNGNNLFDEIRKLSIVAIKKDLPERFIRNLYTSIVIIENAGLRSEVYNEAEKGAKYFIEQAKDEKLMRFLRSLEEESKEKPSEKKKEKALTNTKVSWNKAEEKKE